jgi:hypothetical protein
LKDGIVELAPLNENIPLNSETVRILETMLIEEQQRIEADAFGVFGGVIETNDGQRIGRAGESLSDDEIRSGINWYYRNVIEL